MAIALERPGANRFAEKARKLLRTLTGTEAHERAMARWEANGRRTTGWSEHEPWSWADKIK